MAGLCSHGSHASPTWAARLPSKGPRTAGPQAARQSVHAHPLHVVEPELFAPEDLLEARPAALLCDGGPAAASATAGPSSQQQQQQAAGAHRWFANWFGAPGGSEGPEIDSGESPLREPPFVRSSSLLALPLDLALLH